MLGVGTLRPPMNPATSTRVVTIQEQVFAPPSQVSSATWLAGRAGLAILFIVSGYGKLYTGDAFGQAMAARGIPGAPLLPTLAIVIELGGGFVLLFGAKTRLMAVLFAIYTLVATLIAHTFWLDTVPAVRSANLLHFDKNLAIIGGFLLLATVGGGAFSIDGWRHRRQLRTASIPWEGKT